MNVALTRAKYVLLVVGNANTLSSNETWSDFIDFMVSKKSYAKVPVKDQMKDVINQFYT